MRNSRPVEGLHDDVGDVHYDLIVESTVRLFLASDCKTPIVVSTLLMLATLLRLSVSIARAGGSAAVRA